MYSLERCTNQPTLGHAHVLALEGTRYRTLWQGTGSPKIRRRFFGVQAGAAAGGDPSSAS